MVGLFITGGGPNSSYDTLFINGFRGTRRFTTLNNVDVMVENDSGRVQMLRGGRSRTAAAVVVANTVQKPPRVFIIVVSRAPALVARMTITFVVDRRLPENFWIEYSSVYINIYTFFSTTPTRPHHHQPSSPASRLAIQFDVIVITVMNIIYVFINIFC